MTPVVDRTLEPYQPNPLPPPLRGIREVWLTEHFCKRGPTPAALEAAAGAKNSRGISNESASPVRSPAWLPWEPMSNRRCASTDPYYHSNSRTRHRSKRLRSATGKSPDRSQGSRCNAVWNTDSNNLRAPYGGKPALWQLQVPRSRPPGHLDCGLVPAQLKAIARLVGSLCVHLS